jgi:hypothetical protein
LADFVTLVVASSSANTTAGSRFERRVMTAMKTAIRMGSKLLGFSLCLAARIGMVRAVFWCMVEIDGRLSDGEDVKCLLQ